MRRIIKDAIGIFKALFAIGMIYLIVFFITNGMSVPVRYDGEFDIRSGKFGKNPTWMREGDSLAVAEILARADLTSDSGRLDAMYEIYVLALERLALCEGYGSRVKNVIEFSQPGMAQGVVDTAQIRNVRKLGTPTLSANQPFEYCYQNVIAVKELEASTSIKGVMEGMINKGIREYCDGTDVYAASGTDPYMDINGGGANWKKGRSETYAFGTGIRTYENGELREKSNYIINPRTVISESVAIENVKSADGSAAYRISFKMNCGDGGEDSPVYYEAKSIIDVMGKNLALKGVSAAISMTVCENGYITEWETESNWDTAFNLGFIKLQGSSTLTSKETVSYDSDETRVIDFRGVAA